MRLAAKASALLGRTSFATPSQRAVRAAVPSSYQVNSLQERSCLTPPTVVIKRDASNSAAATAFTSQYAQQQKRNWNIGDVYAPHDLSPAEMRKWGKRSRPTQDVFDILAINPLSLYKNFSVMSDFVSETGRIRPRSETGLRPVNQRRMAKAVRRAIALGLMPSTYMHPELLKKDLRNRR